MLWLHIHIPTSHMYMYKTPTESQNIEFDMGGLAMPDLLLQYKYIMYMYGLLISKIVWIVCFRC